MKRNRTGPFQRTARREIIILPHWPHKQIPQCQERNFKTKLPNLRFQVKKRSLFTGNHDKRKNMINQHECFVSHLGTCITCLWVVPSIFYVHTSYYSRRQTCILGLNHGGKVIFVKVRGKISTCIRKYILCNFCVLDCINGTCIGLYDVSFMVGKTAEY